VLHERLRFIFSFCDNHGVENVDKTMNTVDGEDGEDPLARARVSKTMSRVIHGPREIQIYNETMREMEEATRRKGGLIKARIPASSKLRGRRVIIPSGRWDDVDSLSPRPLIRRWARGVDITPRNLDRRRGKSRPIQRYRNRTATRQPIREDTDISIFHEEDIRRGAGRGSPQGAVFVTLPFEGADRPPPESEAQEANSVHQGSSSTAPPTKLGLSFFFKGSSKRSKSRRVFSVGPGENQPRTQIEVREFGHLSDLQFEERLHELYESTLIYFDENSITVNLASLQRLRLIRLQRDLLEEAFEFNYKNPGTSRHPNASAMHYYSMCKTSSKVGAAC